MSSGGGREPITICIEISSELGQRRFVKGTNKNIRQDWRKLDYENEAGLKMKVKKLLDADFADSAEKGQ